MKRTIAVLLLLAILCCSTAATADPEVWEAIEIDIDGRSLSLGFDASEEYSSVANGTVQASFYTYADNSEYLYELYMTFPVSVQAGSTITPEYAIEYAPDASVVLIVSTPEDERYYFAGQVDGAVYPDESDYTIAFDSVSVSGDTRVYTGRLSAALVAMDLPLGLLTIEDAPFSFTMSVSESDADDPGFPFGTPNPFDDSAAPSPTQKVWKV